MNESLSIIMPVFNEEKTLEKVLDRISETNFPIKTELIIVDDGSEDSTSQILKNISDNNMKVISYQQNRGKGFAVRKGFEHSKGSILCIQDADLEYYPKDLLKLLDLILNGADVVYGSRFLNKQYKIFGKGRLIIPSHLVGNKFLSFMTSIIFGSNITDMETCYKMFRRNVIKDMELEAKGFELEPELTAKILRRGYNIREVPINHSPRSFEEGKKIHKWDGIKALFYLIKYRFFN